MILFAALVLMMGVLPTPHETPLLSVEQLLQAVPSWPGGRSSVYEAIKRGDLPSVRIGRRVLIPTAALRHLLCLDVAVADPRTRNEASASTTEASSDLLATPDPEVRRRHGGYTGRPGR